ncbi:MAG: PD-(D/E)XK nuclease family protein, partial [Acidimicrobiales bacterium]|nr:PD-(D/E)XK nuclease family protein [Acidimicrobiales bacterium]
LHDAKSQDVFAPVTVIVPSNYVAVALRRELATGDYGPTSWVGTGLVGTQFLTSYRLAETVAGDNFLAQERQPVRGVVIGAAIRQVLLDEPGIFGPIVHHGATERELVRVYRELRDLRDDQLDSLAALGERSSEVVRVCTAAHQLLRGQWFDEFDLFESKDLAAETVADLGKLVLFLPQQLVANEIAFLSRLAEISPIVALIGVTGAGEADRDPKRIANSFGARLSPPNVDPSSASKVMSVSDPDDEVRSTVRSVVGLLDHGVAAHQIAVLYPHRDPYGRLLEEHLNASDICFSGVSSRTVANSMPGRFIATLLALPNRDLHVGEVLEFLSSSQLRQHPDNPILVPAVAWSKAALTAGVAGGLGDWSEKLSRHRDRLLATATQERLRTGDDREADRREQQARDVEDLLVFITELNQFVHPETLPTDWEGLCSWVRRAIERYLGPRSQFEAPQGDLAAIERILDNLQSLVRVESRTTFNVFRRSFETQLQDSNERIGKLGQGVFVGDIRQAWGLNFEHTFILGLAEGIFPLPPRKNGLISDEDRSHLDGALPMSLDTTYDDQRRFFAILSSCNSTTLLFPRGDLRQHKENYPTRWLENMASFNGFASLEEALSDPDQPWARHQPSFIAGLRGSAFPASCQEFDLASLLDGRDQNQDLASVRLNNTSAFEAGRQLIDGRNSSSFTRFDGNLSGLVNPNMVRTNVLSPTRLKQWVDCPHSYFMRYVLGVDEPELFRHEFRISPQVRGSLIHEAADRFFRDQVSKGSPPGPERQYSEDDISSMRRFGMEVAAEVEALGLVGRPLFWDRDREQLLNALVGILRFDHQREPRGTVVATELKFGLPGGEFPPLERVLPSGRVVNFRGSIDRVETTSAGNLVVVDYKTGKIDSYRKLSPEDPLLGGSQLQLPLYALAAATYLGHETDGVHSSYWFTSDSQRWATRGYLATQNVLDTFDEAIDVIVDGLEGGLFPSIPTPSASKWSGLGKCVFCDPDQLGTREIEEKWNAVSLLDWLRPYMQLRGEYDVASGENSDNE